MPFDPLPGMQINLGQESIEFTGLEGTGPASKFVYAESGREGTVYRVYKNGSPYALKTLFPAYQDKHVLANAEKLRKYKKITGLRVADRIVVTDQEYSDFLTIYPELKFSILMPWVQGLLWGNIMQEDVPLTKDEYIMIAAALLQAVANLEMNGLAHCDLSNYNFVIDPSLESVELVDIETMYTPGMLLSESGISHGTPGYRASWIEKNGAWGSKADRCATGILCAEILAWSTEKIRSNKAANDSFFQDGEFGENSKRFKLMMDALEEIDNSLPALFRKVWFSKDFDSCPPISDWQKAIENLKLVTVNRSIPKPSISLGNLTVDPAVVDFDVLARSDNSRIVTISNHGNAIVKGTISSAPWLALSANHFSLSLSEKLLITVSLKTDLLPPRNAHEFRYPNGLIITSGSQTEVIGIVYRAPGLGLPLVESATSVQNSTASPAPSYGVVSILPPELESQSNQFKIYVEINSKFRGYVKADKYLTRGASALDDHEVQAGIGFQRLEDAILWVEMNGWIIKDKSKLLEKERKRRSLGQKTSRVIIGFVIVLFGLTLTILGILSAPGGLPIAIAGGYVIYYGITNYVRR